MIFVDTAYIPAKVGQNSLIWCHMSSDTSIEELLTFAQMIGLKPEWLQDKPFSHFDMGLRIRKIAIQRGAVEVSAKELVRRCADIMREDGAK